MALWSAKTDTSKWRRWVYENLNPLAAGQVSISGTPANDQVAVWTDANTIEGTSGFQKTTTQLVAGNYNFNIDQTVGAGQDNYVLTYDNGTGEIGLEAAAGGASAGNWTLLDETSIAGSPSEHKIFWDETTYSDILVIVEGVQPATNAVDFRCTLGEANGATMHETSGDYSGSYREWSNTTRTGLSGADLATPQIVNNASNTAGNIISGYIRISGISSAKMGFYESRMAYINSSGVREVLDTKVYTDNDAAPGHIDTYRLFFAAGNFANTGKIYTYGLVV